MNAMMNMNVGLTDRTYTVSSLHPSTSYMFVVALVNEVGMGSPTNTYFSTSTPTGNNVPLHMVLSEVKQK